MQKRSNLNILSQTFKDVHVMRNIYATRPSEDAVEKLLDLEYYP